MEKKCLRCQTVMLEDYNLAAVDELFALKIRQSKGVFAKDAKIECAICPKCGEISLSSFKMLEYLD